MATYRVEVGYRVSTEIISDSGKSEKSIYNRTVKNGISQDKLKSVFSDLIAIIPEEATEIHAYSYQEEDLNAAVAKY